MVLLGKKKDFERIPVAQLQVGMHISLAEHWWDHPFLLNEFTLEKASQISVIAGLDLTHVLWSPAGSRNHPLEVSPTAATASDATTVAKDEALPELPKLREEREKRNDMGNRTREWLRKAEGAHMHASSELREAFALARITPVGGVRRSMKMVTEAADTFASQANVSIVLLSDRVSGLRLHTHAINVMLLSLLSGRTSHWGATQLRELALGALFHDAGMLQLADSIRIKPEADWTRADRWLKHQHPELGLQMMLDVPAFPEAARAVVAMHHEHVDGSGYPAKLSGEQIPPAARHAAIANRYDELCNPQSIFGALSPSEALSRMYKSEHAHFDRALLTGFIRALGIHPPGTLVELSNGALGLVSGINRDHPTRPLITLWQEDTRREDAPIIDLTIEPELSVSRALRESDLQPEVRSYLTPRTRVAYFYARMDEDGGTNLT